MLAVKQQLGRRILARFEEADQDGDGSVSRAEMHASFGHEPARAGREILGRMMDECAGTQRGGAASCSRRQMEASLASWVDSHRTSRSLALLQRDSTAGFGPPGGHELDGEPCGPAAEPAAAGRIQGVRCVWRGPRCFNHDDAMLAWTLSEVCSLRGCVCEPRPETRRLAKLALAGALAVTTASNFSDPQDEVRAPACGTGWSVTKVLGIAQHLNDLGEEERQRMEATMKSFGVEHAIGADTAKTEAALFRSAGHQLVRGGPLEPVCMISWQPSRGAGDWKVGFLPGQAPFAYALEGAEFSLARGVVTAYDSAREKLKAEFEAQCCSPDFQMKKLVISGHSLGGSLALLNAIDAVGRWSCGGRDLAADDIVVAHLGSASSQMPPSALNNIFSCSDPSRCLAGSVVSVVTDGDFWASGYHEQSRGAPQHPSVIAHVPCAGAPPNATYEFPGSKHNDIYRAQWCHGMFSYVGAFEQSFVDGAGWGSSCGGACDGLNEQVQCNQYVILNARGCSYLPADLLPAPTACTANDWHAEKEVCGCHFDNCTSLSPKGCMA